MKRLLSTVIILLFIGMSISSSTGFNLEKKPSITTANGNTLYVGGSGPGNYTRIQDAIDNASDGDTVYVYDDSSPYDGDVIVNKSITLEGENKESTIIDGLKTKLHGIRILSDNVTVLNFTLQNNPFGGISLEHSKFSLVYNNIIDSNRYGIFIWNSTNNTIYNNVVTNHFVGGIEIHESHYNLVFQNVISDNGNETNNPPGLDLSNARSNCIIRNWITNNSGSGIIIVDSINNSICENNISWNHWAGIWGVFKYNYSQILYNVIKGNNRNGIDFGWSISSYGNISGNLILENNHSGIRLDRSHSYIISANHIENNSKSGLEIGYDCDGNDIFRNFISNNKEFGILCRRTENNIISYNSIKQNKKTGLKLEYSSNIQIINNNFIANRFGAYFILSNDTRWDGNYWNRPRFLPKPIFGRIRYGEYNLLWFNFDWNPVNEPYDIGI